MKKIICNAGIDTLMKKYDTPLELREICLHPAVLGKHSKEGKEKTKQLVIKPSKSINGGNSLTSLAQTIKVIINFEKSFAPCEILGIARLDLSVDIESDINENFKLYKLFLECLNVKRQGKGIFMTRKDLFYIGNLKIKNNRKETTIYNCTDKNRSANTRIENRTLDIRNTENTDEEIIRNEVLKFLREIENIDVNIPIVEKRYITILAKEYKETVGKNFKTFSEFLTWADKENHILTIGILKGLLKELGIKVDYKKFVENFRRSRIDALKFTNKTEVKSLVYGIKKELKKSLKN